MSTANDKFNDAVGALLLGHPFFGTLLLKLEHIEEPTLNPPTMCVTRNTIQYHPEFVDKLTVDETMFVIAHEVMHQAWQHLPRLEYYLRSGVGPDGQQLDVQEYNRAMDYPINDALVKSKVGAPVPEAKWPMCLDPQYPETMTPEEVYCELMKHKRKKGNNGKSKNDKQQPIDSHDSASGAEETNAITPADILQAAHQHKLLTGSLPAGIERLLGQIKRPEVSPWRRLRNFVTKSLPGHDATSWRRLQRRLVVRGIGIPGRVAQGAGRVGIVADTSGSIGQEILDLFGGHMAAIMADAMPRDVVVYWTDAQVHSREVLKTPTELRAYLSKGAKGGGGTNMPEGVRAAEEDGCDAIVVLTDGYTPFCDSKKALLWAITVHTINAPSGVTIHI